jgi:abortive infection bacteriophage resistance protein
MYSLLYELPSKYRDMVSHECSWSGSTYRRRMKIAPHAKNPFQGLSNAEVGMIITIMDGIVGNLVNEYKEFKETVNENLYEFKEWTEADVPA